MEKAKKKRMSGFARGMILYVLLFILVAGLGLLFLYRFLENYEYTRENRVMERYIASVSDEQLQSMSAGFLSQLNSELSDMDSVRSFISDKVANADFAKKMAECTETKSVYVLKDEDGAFGRVELTLGDKIFHSLLQNWQPTAAELDFSAFLNELDVTVPADYTVECNGFVLNEKYVVDDGVEYELLKEFYEDFELPHLVSYHADGFIGEAEVTVRDGAGNEIDDSQLSEEFFTDNCSDSKKGQLDEFINRYIAAYVTFTSGANHMTTINYHNVDAMIVPGSELHERVLNAVGGLGFASSHGDEIKKITVNRYMDLGGGMYLCDVTYDVATYGQDGLHEYPNNTKIIITENGDGFLAYSMASY